MAFGRLARMCVGTGVAIGITSAIAPSFTTSLDRDDASSWLSAFLPVAHAHSKNTANNNNSTALRKSAVQFGAPIDQGMRHLPRTEHVVSFNGATKNPNWVCEHLTKYSIQQKGVDRDNCDFQSDPAIHSFFRTSNADFKGSGYDRGHMAAAANHRSSLSAMQETFYLTNISPQVGAGFNRDAWATLENYCRRLTNVYTDVYVVSGPLYLPKTMSNGKKFMQYEVIGPNNVAVPTHFFKVVAGEMADGKIEIQAFIMPNKQIESGHSLSEYLVPLEEAEKLSGFLFFEKVTNKYKCVMRKGNQLIGRFAKRDRT
eukprot:m.15888 g.15888  ORF g.15888 m.15888 type:complete len:314 (+) comp6833_c0_seq1:219-1160(+)